MTARLSFPLVREVANGMVHIQAVPAMDFVTLCGITDWLTATQGVLGVRGPVTCNGCRWIADFCHAHRPLRKARAK